MGSYWNKEKIKTETESLRNRVETDVCIIGGGLTGLTTGYYLSKAGKNIVILEKNNISEHVSGHTTGKITSQHGLIYKYLIDSKGKNFAQKYYEANENAINNIEKIVKEEKIDCDLERQDSYVFTQDKTEVEKIKMEVDAVKSFGGQAEFVNDIDFIKECKGAIKFKNQAQFHPKKYANGLCTAILKNNGKIYENSKALGIENRNGKFLVQTKDGEVISKYLVIATHYPILNSLGYYFFKMYQSMSYAIMCNTDRKIFEGMYINSEQPTISLRNVKTEDGRRFLVVGSDHKTGSKIDLKDSYSFLENIAKEMYSDAKVEYKWNTEDCITLDKIPYIGEFSKFMTNAYIGTGYNKWGMSSSNIAGKIISDEILGIENEYKEVFKATRVEPLKNIKEVESMLKETTNSLIINKFKIPPETMESVKRGEGKIVSVEGQKVGIYCDKNGEYFAINPVCSHLGCELSWNNLSNTWDCPCHGSRFNYKGESIEAPSIKKLQVFE